MITTGFVLADRYRLVRPLGHGGTAQVWRGVDRVTRRAVAVKIGYAGAALSSSRSMFAQEAQIHARLDDPLLARLHDFGVLAEPDGTARPWIVMEFVAGRSLATHLVDGAVRPARVARIGWDVAQALAYVHRVGVVHRDLKPGNVIVADRGPSRLVDFGISQLNSSRNEVSSEGCTIGTAAYLAPEQFAGAPITPATDVFSLGLVLLEALTARRAFTPIHSPADIDWRRQHGPMIPLSIGPRWSRLIDAMTAVHPGDRPAAGDVVDALVPLRATRRPVVTSLPPAAPLLVDDLTIAS